MRMLKCKTTMYNENGEPVQEHNYKFHLDQEVWYIQRGWRRVKVYKARISAFVFTNCPSYQLSNGNVVLEESVFETEREAVERAMWLNERDRVLGK